MEEIIGLVAMILFILLIVFLIVAHKSNMSELEKENKMLHGDIELYKNNILIDMQEITELEIENRELKMENIELKKKLEKYL